MRTRSPKTQRLIRAYIPQARRFIEDNPICQFPLGCATPSSVIHHRRGRRGRRLLDQTWWAASCNHHNQWAEDHTGEALACGWLIRIEGCPEGAS